MALHRAQDSQRALDGAEDRTICMNKMLDTIERRSLQTPHRTQVRTLDVRQDAELCAVIERKLALNKTLHWQ